MIGKSLAHYEVIEQVGAGGMGVVYRARDTRLGREVALKFLPERAAADPERLARFRREARILAALKHPGIAAIHGLEEVDGQVFCVLEFVSGETLGKRLRRGPVPFPEALRLLLEIATALAAAHEQGIIHRDIKPENLMIEPSGNAKVLDFGLAKSFVPSEPDHAPASATTITAPLTLPGMIRGSVHYMSPEQARGEELDRRTDVWSFGCVMYDLLAGRRAFEEPTPTEVIAAILKDEPDWSELPSGVPPRARRLLQRCLRKDRARRLHDLHDARIELEEILESLDHPETEALEVPRRGRSILPLAAVAVLLATAGGFLARSIRSPSGAGPREVHHLTMALPATTPLGVEIPGALALSPDGRRLVFTIASETGPSLCLREMNRPDPEPLAGTEGGHEPFFSPDGGSVAFFAEEMLKRVPLDGGPAIAICEAPRARGGTWSENGTIVFAAGDSGSGLFRVPAAGGVPRMIALRPSGESRRRLSWPSFLPGGESVVAIAGTGFLYEPSDIALVRLEDGRLTILTGGDLAPVYHPSGFVVASRGRSLVAVPVDSRRGRAKGDPFVVSEDLWSSGVPQFALSRDGTLAYALEGEARSEAGGQIDRTPVWVSAGNELRPLGAPARRYVFPNLSPDGKFVAFSILGEKTIGNWVYSIERGTLSPLTRRGNEHLPVWTPDGKRIAFASDVAGMPNLYWMAADGTGEVECLTRGDNHQCPGSFSPNGRYLSYTDASPGIATDIFYLDLAGDRSPRPFAVSASSDRQGMISPDGGWIAYTSNRSGWDEIYVERFPEGGGRLQVSASGGWNPLWDREGRRLFYWRSAPQQANQPSQTQIWSVEADLRSAPPRFEAPRLFAEGRFKDHFAARPNYDVSLDGESLLLLTDGEESIPPRQVHVVLNWASVLEAR